MSLLSHLINLTHIAEKWNY